MNIDQNQFMNLVIEKTTNKLHQATSQLIILESQLQVAIETNKKLTEEIEKLKTKKEKIKDDFSSPS